MIKVKLIQTERLLIRPLYESDSAFIFDLLNTNGWIKNIGNKNINKLEDALKYIQMIHNRANCDYYIFESLEDKTPMGISTLIKRENQSYYDIGFAILPEFEGKGYSFEASKALLQVIENSGKTNKILGITLRNNQRSISLLIKLGFIFLQSKTENNEDLVIYEKTITQNKSIS